MTTLLGAHYFRRKAVSLFTLLILAVAMSGWAVPVVTVDDNFNGSTPGFGVTAFNTIPTGFAAVDAGGTMNVNAGTYNLGGLFTINKSVNMVGPQANVDPRLSVSSTRVANNAAEATLNGGGGFNNLIRIEADNVSINGFSITNVFLDLVQSQVGTGPHTGVVFSYNIVSNNSFGEGIHLQNAPGAIISFNRIFSTSSDSIRLEGNVNGSQVLNNDSNASNSTSAAIYVLDNNVTNANFNVTVSGNTVTNTGTADGIAIGQTGGNDDDIGVAVVSDNTIDNTSGDGIEINCDNVQILNNTLTNCDGAGGNNGAILINGANAGITITGNTVGPNAVTGANAAGIFIDSDVVVASLVVSCNTIDGNTPYGLRKIGTGVVIAENNYWGDPSGPNDDANVINGTGDAISLNVDASPFQTTPGAADPTFDITTLAFGPIDPNDTQSLTCELFNTSGCAPLTVNSIDITGSTAFTVTSPSFPIVISAGGSVTITVQYDPAGVVGASDAATATTDSDGTTEDSFTLTGTTFDAVQLVVTPTSLSVAEGGTNSFNVSLDSDPNTTVQVDVSSGAGDADITVSSGSILTFDSSNFSTPQAVTLAAAEDDSDVDNGTTTFDVSSAASFVTNDPITVTATEDDDDPVNLVVDADNPEIVPEGGTATFTVALDSAPVSPLTVDVAFASGDLDISVQSGASLNFDSSNFSTPQTVTLAAAEDFDFTDGTTTFEVSSSSFLITNDPITVTAQEDGYEEVNLLVSASDPFDVPEGGTASFTVALDAAPALPVTVDTTFLAGDSDLTVFSGGSLNFDGSNFSTPQTVTLAAAEDFDFTNGTATFSVASTSSLVGNDPIFVNAREDGYDAVNLVVTAADPVVVPEGGTNTFTVALDAAPPFAILVETTANLGGDPDLTISGGSSLSFDSSNFSVPQTVTISAAEDFDFIDGVATFSVASASPIIVNDPVEVNAQEDGYEEVQLVVSAANPVLVSEGGTNTFTVRLDAEPAFPITVDIAFDSGDADLTVSAGSSLSFDSSNFDTAQTVTLAAAEDDSDVDDGTASFLVSTTAGFVTNDPITVNAQEVDDDEINLLVVAANPVIVPEGGSNTFTIALDAAPLTPITVDTVFGSGDADLSVSSGAALVFDSSNFGTPQTVTLSAAEDFDFTDGSATFNVSSASFQVVNDPITVNAQEDGYEEVGLVVAAADPVVVPEGGTNTFTVALDSAPALPVTVDVRFDSGDADLSVSSGDTLNFDSSNFSTPQTVTLAAAEDFDFTDGTAVFVVSTASPLVTNDPINVNAIEDGYEEVGLVVAAADPVVVPEGGTNTFTVALDSAPALPVTVDVRFDSGDADLSVSSGDTLNFDGSNFSVPQTVTLAAAEDFDFTDGTALFVVSTASPLVTNDPINVNAIEDGYESVDLVVTAADPVVVAEGGTSSFTVALATQPALPVTVTVAFATGDADLSVSSGATLNFDDSNFGTPQTVTLAAADDVDTLDGAASFSVESASPLVVNDPIAVNAMEDDNDTDDINLLVVADDPVIVPEGGTATFTVALDAAPLAPINVDTRFETGDADLSVSSGETLTFDSSNFSTPQTVTLAAAPDFDFDDGTATFSVSSSSIQVVNDPIFVNAQEDGFDEVNLVVAASDPVIVPETGTNTFTVALDGPPAIPVDVSVTFQSGDADLSVQSGGFLSFDSSNFDTPQVVTLAAAQDLDFTDGTAIFGVETKSSIVGNDPIFVNAQEDGIDQVNLVVAAADPVVVAEDGTNTFTVALDAAPGVPVTVDVAFDAGDSDLSVQSGASLSFDGSNFDTPQTVTLAAALDADTDDGTATFLVSSASLLVANSPITVNAQEDDDGATGVLIAYVDDDFNSGTPGWQVDHFDVIQDGVDAVVPTGTVFVAEGIYPIIAPIALDKPVSVFGPQTDIDPRPSANTTRVPAGPEEAVIDGDGVSATLVEISDSNVIFNGFSVTDGTGDLIASLAATGPHDAVYVGYNIVFSSSGDEGVQLRNTTNTDVEYNYVFDVAGDGINLAEGMVGGAISFNEVADVTSTNGGIYVYDLNATNADFGVTIEGNLVRNSAEDDGIAIGAKNGADNDIGGVLVINNVIDGANDDGVEINANDVTLAGNTIRNANGEGGGGTNGGITVEGPNTGIVITGNRIGPNVVVGTEAGGVVIVAAADAASFVFTCNVIDGNEPYGVLSFSDTVLNAEGNFWGAADGPDDDEGVINGSGDAISTGIDADPFLTGDSGGSPEFDPIALTFGPIDPDTTETQSSTLTNLSLCESLEVTEIDISGTGAAAFALINQTVPFSLAPGESVILEFVYDPAGPGADDSAVATTVSTAPVEATVTLNGTSFDPVNIVVDPVGDVVVAEGGSAAVNVTLDAAPDVPVTLDVAIAGDADITVDVASLTFDASDFDRPQTITISAAEDLDALDGTATLTMSSTSSIVTNAPFNVSVVEDDNDAPAGVDPVYVDDDFDINTPGWLVDHFDNIQDGHDAVTDGGTIFVFAGNYDVGDDQIVITKSVTMVGPQADVDPRPSASTTRLIGDPLTEALITGDASLGTIVSIRASNVSFNGFQVFEGAGDLIASSGGIGQPIHDNIDIIYNIVYSSSGDEGIQIRNAQNSTIAYNHVFDTAGDGINFAFGPVGSDITNNEVHDVGSGNGAIYVYDENLTNVPLNVVIQGNLLYDIHGEDAIRVGTPNGNDTDTGGFIVTGNTVLDAADDALEINIPNGQVTGNVFMNTSGQGAGPNGAIVINRSGIGGILIQGNTIEDNSLTGTSAAAVFFVAGADTVTSNVVCNNFSGNTPYAINTASGTFLFAEGNYFGAADGPDDDDGVINGSGDAIGTNIDADPFLSAPAGSEATPDTQSVDFGTIAANATAEATATVTADGSCFSLLVSDPGVAITGPDFDHFTLLSPATFPVSVANSNSLDLLFLYNPLGEENATHTATATLVANDGTPATIELVGNSGGALELVVTADNPVIVAEGSVNSFSVSLDQAPADPVTVTTTFASGDADLSVMLGGTLVFDASNFDVPQTVVIAAGKDADFIDGTATFTVETSGPELNASVTVNAQEDDNDFDEGSNDLIVVADLPMNVPEETSGTFTVRLEQAPAGTVTVGFLIVGGNSVYSVDPVSLTFDASNFDVPQTVTVSHADDANYTPENTIIVVFTDDEFTDIEQVLVEGPDNDPEASGFMVR